MQSIFRILDFKNCFLSQKQNLENFKKSENGNFLLVYLLLMVVFDMAGDTSLDRQVTLTGTKCYTDFFSASHFKTFFNCIVGAR